jgi:hypothetical protein
MAAKAAQRVQPAPALRRTRPRRGARGGIAGAHGAGISGA